MSETIRSYTSADFIRVTRAVGGTDRQLTDIDAVKDATESPSYDLGRRSARALAVADAMFERHGDWFEGKIAPLRPYLHRDGEKRTDNNTIKRRFRDGLKEAVSAASLTSSQKIDYQDLTAGFTGSFLTMIRSCQRIGVNPDAALELAGQSYRIRPEDVKTLFAANPDLSPRVIERAALHYDRVLSPEEFVRTYRQKALQVEEFRAVYGDQYPTELLAEAVYREKDPPTIEQRRIEIAEQGDTFSEASGWTHVDGIRKIRQRHQNWCGFSVLSMYADYLGYPELTPEVLFRQEYGYYDPILEDMDPVEGPALSTLALLTQELTELKPRRIDPTMYDKIRERNPRLQTPYDVLQQMLHQGPAILRVRAHYLLATGYNSETDTYSAIDPLFGNEPRITKRDLDAKWRSSSSYDYNGDTRHLMLLLRTK